MIPTDRFILACFGPDADKLVDSKYFSVYFYFFSFVVNILHFEVSLSETI